jgi:glutamate 5-kinase
LYSADPRRDPQARLLHEVAQIDTQIWEMAGGSGTHRGTGGMFTKIRAEDLATRSGCEVVIASGFEPDALLRVVRGEQLGTRFRCAVSHVEARKRWLLAETVMDSRVEVDDGAARALVEQGKSLLPAGITAVQGSFGRGQTVRVYNNTGREIARGMTQYGAAELTLIRGRQSTQIADVLGYDYGSEVIHRDDMVLL